MFMERKIQYCQPVNSSQLDHRSNAIPVNNPASCGYRQTLNFYVCLGPSEDSGSRKRLYLLDKETVALWRMDRPRGLGKGWRSSWEGKDQFDKVCLHTFSVLQSLSLRRMAPSLLAQGKDLSGETHHLPGARVRGKAEWSSWFCRWLRLL